jgi:hypothetical protein
MTTNKIPGDKPVRSGAEATDIRPSRLGGKVQLQAGTADAVLAVVPHLLGFYPTRSLVVLGLGERSRVMVTFRYDLPDPPDIDLADDIAEHAEFVLNRERIFDAMLVGYGPDDLVAPVMLATAGRLAKAGVALREALLADAGRFWSLLCQDPDCCPAEGRRYDPGSHPAAAAMASAGLTALPDREALERTLQRPAGAADRIARDTSSAQTQLANMLRRCATDGDGDPHLRQARVGRRAVQRAIGLYRTGGQLSQGSALTWIALMLQDLRVRDDAWARMDARHNDAHRRLWTDVVRHAAQDCVAGPASLLAFTAWQAGNGALAVVAIDRALQADPAYSMAKLLSRAVEAALPPSAAHMPMSPAAVARSYAPAPAAVAGDAASGPGPGGSSGAGGDSSAGSGSSRTAGPRPGGDCAAGGAGAGFGPRAGRSAGDACGGQSRSGQNRREQSRNGESGRQTRPGRGPADRSRSRSRYGRGGSGSVPVSRR